VAVTIINLEAIPDDLPPGTYCCRLDESSSLVNGAGFRARFIIPPRPHVPGDCLIQIVKAPEEELWRARTRATARAR